jgi:hypothetical protein
VEALAALRQGAIQDDCPTDGAANPEGKTTMSSEEKKITAPVTREVKRTPVSPDLAEKIRAVDTALEAEFAMDFAFVILAKGALVSSSNSRDGVVPPMIATGEAGEGG